MLMGETAIRTFQSFRVLVLSGRYGGYKTALASRLGIEFVERGWAKHIICNYPFVAASDPRRLPELRDTFMILDEGGSGRWLNEKTFGDTVAFLRKRNLYVVIPSVLPPVMSARFYYGQMIFDGHAVGLDAVWFTFRLSLLEVKERYRLTWYRTKEVWGLYDTAQIAANAGGILEYVRREFAKDGVGAEVEYNPNDSSLTEPYAWVVADDEKDKPGKKAKRDRPAVAEGQGLEYLEEQRRLAEHVYEGAREFSEAVSVLEKRRRR